jgi:hypothetical protein
MRKRHGEGVGGGDHGGQGGIEGGGAAPPPRSLALARRGLRTAGDVTAYMLATLEDEAMGHVNLRQLDKRARAVIATAMMARAAGPETVLDANPR